MVGGSTQSNYIKFKAAVFSVLLNQFQEINYFDQIMI